MPPLVVAHNHSDYSNCHQEASVSLNIPLPSDFFFTPLGFEPGSPVNDWYWTHQQTSFQSLLGVDCSAVECHLLHWTLRRTFSCWLCWLCVHLIARWSWSCGRYVGRSPWMELWWEPGEKNIVLKYENLNGPIFLKNNLGQVINSLQRIFKSSYL